MKKLFALLILTSTLFAGDAAQQPRIVPPSVSGGEVEVGDLPATVVYTDTEQTITNTKTFEGGVFLNTVAVDDLTNVINFVTTDTLNSILMLQDSLITANTPIAVDYIYAEDGSARIDLTAGGFSIGDIPVTIAAPDFLVSITGAPMVRR